MQLTISDMECISFCDPASGKKSKESSYRRARSAIVTIAVDRISRVFVLQAWADRVPTTKLLDKIFETQQLYHPRRFGCEAGGMQSILSEWISEQKRLRGVRLPLIPVVPRVNVDKDWAIRTALQPLLANGRLFIQEKHFELKSEIQQHPQGTLKDLLDALRHAIMLAPRLLPSDNKGNEAQRLRGYLERSNMPKEYIEERLKELDLE